MRETIVTQLNDLLVGSDPNMVEKVLFASLQLADDSDLAYHRCAVVKDSKIRMTGLCVLGCVIDGVPIAGVYDNDGKLIGFK